MIEENLPEGAYRQKVYDMVQSTIKRDLTANEHVALRTVLKAYVNAHTANVAQKVIHLEEPRKHIFICAQCDASISGKGNAFFKQRKHRIVKEKKKDDAPNKEA